MAYSWTVISPEFQPALWWGGVPGRSEKPERIVTAKGNWPHGVQDFGKWKINATLRIDKNPL
jgi:hypothetical protein